MNFQKLIEIREDFNLKQKDIASVLGITQQSYSLWENGSKIIPLKHLNNLCNYYNLSMDYVIGLSNIKYYNVINKKIDKILIGERLRKIRKEKNEHGKKSYIIGITSINTCNSKFYNL